MSAAGPGGRVVRVRMRKHPDEPHWEYEARWLGADATGHWLGVPAGTPFTRPGRTFTAPCDHVTLFPHEGWYAATTYAAEPSRPVDVYVDITTPATWDGDTVGCVDLDLDVVRTVAGETLVLDEDEFEQRRAGYPADLAERALVSCAEVRDALAAGEAAYDGRAAGWLAKLRQQLRGDGG